MFVIWNTFTKIQWSGNKTFSKNPPKSIHNLKDFIEQFTYTPDISVLVFLVIPGMTLFASLYRTFRTVHRTF
jgi:hypothetical protein